MRKSRWLDACWLIGCLLASSAWCITAARELSATFDEPLYVARGLERWRSGSYAGLMKLGTMPLPIDCDTLPLYIYERWTGQPIDPVRDLDRVLPWARFAAIGFWWLLLVYGWLAGRSLAGPWGGRLAVAWLACEPNLLAHASLATTDIAISACLLALVYHFRVGRDGRWWRRIGVPGVWFAAALLAKASGMVFGPLCLVAVEIYRLWFEPRSSSICAETSLSAGNAVVERNSFRFAWWKGINSVLRGSTDRDQSAHTRFAVFAASFRDLVQVAAIGFVLMFLYCGCDWRPEPSFVVWAHKLPEGPAREAMVWLSEHLRIFSNAGEGLVRQIKHNMRGHHGSYLLGQTYSHPLWYYFPLALVMKLSLPLLLAPIVVAIGGRWTALRMSPFAPRKNALSRSERRLKAGRIFAARRLNWALAAAMLLFVFSLNCRVQIGIRLVLPLVTFFVVGLAAALVAATRQSRQLIRPLWIAGAVSAVLWTSVASWRVWPEGLCYTNELWGGTSNGYLCLSDSNYDWGQGIKELAAWPGQHGVEHLDVWYFGTDPAVNAAPLRNLPLHVLPIGKPDDVRAYVQGRYLAVGTTLLYGTSLGLPAHHSAIEFFRARQPVARTSTFLIYDLAASSAVLAQKKSADQR